MERVKTFSIPQEVRDCVLAPEDLWSIIRQGGGWQAWTGHINHGGELVMGTIHRNTVLDSYPHLIPEFVKKIPQYVDDGETLISTFVSDCEGTENTLNWHIDGYEVYAFNVEGNTVWEYFDLDTGKIEEVALGEMDKLIYMPCGISHRVKLMSETRTSMSLVRPGTLNGLRVETERESKSGIRN